MADGGLHVVVVEAGDGRDVTSEVISQYRH